MTWIWIDLSWSIQIQETCLKSNRKLSVLRSVKLLDLSWSIQIQETCLKANRKLSFLRSVKLLDRKTLDLLYKVTVRSLIDYALPIYGNNLRQIEINRLEQLQYRAAKLVVGALKYTSREKLNKELGWETIQKRIEYLGLSIIHKIHVGDTRPLLKKCLTKLDREKKHNLRSKGGYLPYPNYGNKFLNSFFPYITKIWNNLPTSVKSLNLLDFKTELKSYLKPDKFKHFRIGSKDLNSILTRFRTGRTSLNACNYSIWLTDDPSCICHYKSETSEHYLLDYFGTVLKYNIWRASPKSGRQSLGRHVVTIPSLRQTRGDHP